MNDSSDRCSDGELVEICNTGGPTAAAAAFGVLYQRHREYVLRVALRFTHDRDLAADALQETFVYLLRQFPPTGSGFTLTARMQTFLYTVAKSCSITALRKRGRFEPSGIEPDDLAAEQPAGDSGSDDLDRALAGLSNERREVLMLRFVDGMALQEIADALDVPLGTVKSRLHLGIRQLRHDPTVKSLFGP